MKAIVNTKLITENGMIWDAAVTFENGRILQADWADRVQLPTDAEIIDAQGLYTAPGFVDIHCHGGPDGPFIHDPLPACRYHLSHGTTTVLPAFTHHWDGPDMLKGMERCKTLSASGPCRIIGGLYMEGPYMNGSGGRRKDIRWKGEIDPAEYEPLVNGMKGYAKIWAIDPARPGIEGFMQYVNRVDPDAMFANGHSTATFAQCRKVRKYGVRVQTHFNDSGQARGFAQGTAGSGCDHYTLHEPDLYAELICDETGIHVDADLIKTLIRTKGVERVCLITDFCSRPTNYKSNEAEGIHYAPDLNYDTEGHLAGSKLSMDNCVRNVMKHTAYGLCHAVRMASYNPACLLGMDDEIGSLAPGKKANILIMDDRIRIRSVYLEGDLAVRDGALV